MSNEDKNISGSLVLNLRKCQELFFKKITMGRFKPVDNGKHKTGKSRCYSQCHATTTLLRPHLIEVLRDEPGTQGSNFFEIF